MAVRCGAATALCVCVAMYGSRKEALSPLGPEKAPRAAPTNETVTNSFICYTYLNVNTNYSADISLRFAVLLHVPRRRGSLRLQSSISVRFFSAGVEKLLMPSEGSSFAELMKSQCAPNYFRSVPEESDSAGWHALGFQLGTETEIGKRLSMACT